MDIQWLVTFKTIIETGSFSNAADKLGYTQSTITSQIHQLELELSVKLFEKIGRRMLISDAGKQLLPQIEEILESTSRLKNFHHADKDFTGNITIAITETIIIGGIGPILQTFIEKAPKVSVKTISGSCNEIRNMVKFGTADIGVIYTDPKSNSDSLLIEKTLLEIPLVLVGPNDSSKIWNNETGLPIGQNIMCLNDPKCVIHDIYKRYLKSRGVSSDRTVSLGSTENILSFIETGKGFTYIPRYIVADRLREGKLKELFIDTDEKTAYISYVVHKNKWISPSIQLFISLLERNIPAMDVLKA